MSSRNDGGLVTPVEPAKAAGPDRLHPNASNTDWLPAEAVRELGGEEIRRRLEALEGLVAANAAEAERRRRPVDEVFSAIRQTGVFYLYVPERHGGMEDSDLQTQIDVVLPIARGCASTAWCVSLGIQQQFIIAQFPEETQRLVWEKLPYVIAAAAGFPPGKAERVPGGMRVDGHWKWASGVMHSSMASPIVLLREPDAPPVPYSILVPIDEITVLDTWYVDGVCASGSHDIVIEDLFVPDDMVTDFREVSSGKVGHENPFYRIPLAPLLALTVSLPVLGAAQGALALFEDRVTSGGGARSLRDKEAVHAYLGKARLDLDAAELIIRRTAEELQELADSAEPIQLLDRVRVRARFSYACKLCRESVREMSELAGSSAHFLANPLQRIVRDVNVMTTHAILDATSSTELLGRVELGLPSNHEWFK